MNVEAQPALLGHYHAPQFTYVSSVKCHIRGQVIVTKLTDAPSPGRSGSFLIDVPAL